jgi:hypothetical protein
VIDDALRAFTCVAEWFYKDSALGISPETFKLLETSADRIRQNLDFSICGSHVSRLFGALPHGFSVLQVLGFHEAGFRAELRSSWCNKRLARALFEFLNDLQFQSHSNASVFEARVSDRRIFRNMEDSRESVEISQSMGYRNWTGIMSPLMEEFDLSALEALEAFLSQRVINQELRLSSSPAETSSSSCQSLADDSWLTSKLEPVAFHKKGCELGKYKESKCSICLEDWCEGDSVKQLRCEHVFHDSCIRASLSRKLSCPVCRHHIQ